MRRITIWIFILLLFLIPSIYADSGTDRFPYQNKFYGLPGNSQPVGLTFFYEASGNNTAYYLVSVNNYSSNILFDSRYLTTSGYEDTTCDTLWGTSAGGGESLFWYYFDNVNGGDLMGIRIHPLQHDQGGSPVWCDVYPFGSGACNETVDIQICKVTGAYDVDNWTAGCSGTSYLNRCVGGAFTNLYMDYPLSNLNSDEWYQINFSAPYGLAPGDDYIMRIASDGDTNTKGHVCIEGYKSISDGAYYLQAKDTNADGNIDGCSPYGYREIALTEGNYVLVYGTTLAYQNLSVDEYPPVAIASWKTNYNNTSPQGITWNFLGTGTGGKYYITDDVEDSVFVYEQEANYTASYIRESPLDSENSDSAGIWCDTTTKYCYIVDRIDMELYVYKMGETSDDPINYLDYSCSLDPRNTQPYGIMSSPGFSKIFITDMTGWIYTYSLNCNLLDRYAIYPFGNQNASGIAPGFMAQDLITTIYVSDSVDTGVYFYNYSLIGQTCIGKWINYMYYYVWENSYGGTELYGYDAYCSVPNSNWCEEGITPTGNAFAYMPETWEHYINDSSYIFTDRLFSCDSECNLTVTYCPYGCVNGQCLRQSDQDDPGMDYLINQIVGGGRAVKEGGESIFNQIFPNQADRMLFGFIIMIITAIGIIWFSVKNKVKDMGGVFLGIGITELVWTGIFIAYQIFPWYIGFIYIVPIAWFIVKVMSGGIFHGGK